jgi:putative ABC transport system permease protein
MSFVVVPEGTDPDRVKQEYYRRLDQAREDFVGEFERIECMLGSLEDLAIAHFTNSDSSDSESGGGIIAYGSVIGLMIVFMLFPAINLVNINASRIIERSSEVGVRRAFGASRSTLVGQFLVENTVLTLIGGAIALVLSFIVLDIITDSGLFPYGSFGFNLRVFLYALVLCLFFGVFSGVLPAYRMSRMHPVEALRGDES